MWDDLTKLSAVFMITGAAGMVAAAVLVKMGYGRRAVGALSRGSRMAIRAVANGFKARSK